jgi:hypothetical protein
LRAVPRRQSSTLGIDGRQGDGVSAGLECVDDVEEPAVARRIGFALGGAVAGTIMAIFLIDRGLTLLKPPELALSSPWLGRRLPSSGLASSRRMAPPLAKSRLPAAPLGIPPPC